MSKFDVVPGTSFTEAENEDLIRLLQKVAKDDFRWPTEGCMRAAHAVVPYPAFEFVVLDYIEEKNSILLTTYEGGIEEYRGFWHIPGGYINNKYPDKQAVCSAIAGREIGLSNLMFADVFAVYWWKPGEHPYGRPVSIFVRCVPRDKKLIVQTEKLHFFPTDALPQNIVPVHLRFIREHFPPRAH